MEIFIGIRDNTRQLALDVDMTENELMAKVNEALVSANGVLDLTDTKGQRTLVPAHALGYVQIAASASRSTDAPPDAQGRGAHCGTEPLALPGLVYARRTAQAFRKMSFMRSP